MERKHVFAALRYRLPQNIDGARKAAARQDEDSKLKAGIGQAHVWQCAACQCLGNGEKLAGRRQAMACFTQIIGFSRPGGSRDDYQGRGRRWGKQQSSQAHTLTQ